MSKLRVNCFAISIDGFGAGPDQSIKNPLGAGGFKQLGYNCTENIPTPAATHVVITKFAERT